MASQQVMQGGGGAGAPAAVEDYDSDTSKAVPGTKKTAIVDDSLPRKDPTPAVAARKILRPGPIDAASDSGYSSHTHATVASLDSGPAPRPTLGRRRESLQRTSPTRSSADKMEPCADPGCDECRRDRRRSMTRPSPLERPMEVNYPPFVHPGPARGFVPGYQYPAQTPAPVAVPRPMPVPLVGRPRPQSYHAGATDYHSYWSSDAAMSAYDQMYAQRYPYRGSNVYAGGYTTLPPIVSSQQQQPVRRPPLQHAMTDTMSARRPAPPSARPIVTYGMEDPRFSYPYEPAPPSTRRGSIRPNAPRASASYYEEAAYSSDSEDERRARRHRDASMMPPPPRPSSRNPTYQPTISSAALSIDSSRRPRRERSRTDSSYRYREYDYMPSSSRRESERTRRPSHPDRRASQTSNPPEDLRIYRGNTGNARVIIDARHGRRTSYIVPQPTSRIDDNERRRRDSQPAEDKENCRRSSRTTTDPEDRRRRRPSQTNEEYAEAYINSVRGVRAPADLTAETIRESLASSSAASSRDRDRGIPAPSRDRDRDQDEPTLTTATSKVRPAMKRAPSSVVSSSSHHSSSHHSRRSSGPGVEVTSSATSSSQRITKTDDGDFIIRNIGLGTTFEFAGDMEGRKVSWRANELDGSPELIIGAAPGRQKTYAQGGSVKSSGARSKADNQDVPTGGTNARRG